ncbi:DUF502 domain-containing protein [Oleisolibacter albus]|uniref:DUF502 domain-containing protein n=1 Tax=Oleisolibacter albus TaxID=2171757 RepID=UPI001EFDD171|nr:DUF502 domain-containing protein [Oleisolibacter albus]
MGGKSGGTEKTLKRAFGLGLAARLRAYLFAGILVTAPVTITLYLVWVVVGGIDALVTAILPTAYNPETYLPFTIPGVGVLLVLVALILIGMFAAGFLGRLVVRLGEAILGRMPIVRGIYAATKQIFETVLANQSDAFREVVLVEYPRKGMWSIAFITGTTQGEVQSLTEDEVVNVFVPTTPNPTSGYLLFVPRQDLVKLSMSVEDGLKMVVSGGIVTPPERPAAVVEGGALTHSA